MPTLTEILLADGVRPTVQTEVRSLVDAEVADKKGASGIAVRAGYGAVRKVGPSIVDDAIRKLLPGFVQGLDPFWQGWSAAPAGRFSEYLVSHQDAVADALLGVTDRRIENTSKSAVKKAYGSMRGSAKKNVVEALPRLGDLVQRHAD